MRMRKRAEWSDREWMEYDRKNLIFHLEEIIDAAYRHYDSNAAQDPDGFYTGYYLGIADELQDLISFINDKGLFRR